MLKRFLGMKHVWIVEFNESFDSVFPVNANYTFSQFRLTTMPSCNCMSAVKRLQNEALPKSAKSSIEPFHCNFKLSTSTWLDSPAVGEGGMSLKLTLKCFFESPLNGSISFSANSFRINMCENAGSMMFHSLSTLTFTPLHPHQKKKTLSWQKKEKTKSEKENEWLIESKWMNVKYADSLYFFHYT